MVLLWEKDLSRMTSRRPPWPDAQTSGTPLSGGDNCPSMVTMRMRPGRSVTSILPSGRNASDHGLTRPRAKVRTSRPPADDGNSVSSPRVPVAITNVAVSRIAAVSAAVTSPTGVFIIVRLRCQSSRVALEVALGKDANRKSRDHAGIGMAMDTLIESTVSVTTRHSDSVPIARQAAIALFSRGEATGAGRLPKPAAPGDRIMVQILQDADESSATSGK